MHPELKWFLILLVALWLGWFITGGPSRVQINRANPLLEPPAPIGNGSIYSPKDLKK